jgi:hypothetical protein
MNGSILVKVQNGYELDELHDVFVGGVSTALPLVYNSTSSGWVAQALTSVGIADNAVVAAKIAANSVGVTKIDSGAATSGQVLQANGSGGASFTTFAAGVSLTASTVTATINNTIKQAIIASAQTYSPSRAVPIEYDELNDRIYAHFSTTSIRKINGTTGSTIATITPSVGTSVIRDIALSDHTNPYLCVVTANQYFIIDSSAGTTIATGDIRPTGATLGDAGLVRYDPNKSQFVITQSVLSSAVETFLIRTVDASTQTTRYVRLANTLGYVNESGVTTSRALSIQRCHPPIWNPLASRWAVVQSWSTSSGAIGQMIFMSETTDTAAFLTVSGKRGLLGATGSSSEMERSFNMLSDGSGWICTGTRYVSGGASTAHLIMASSISSAYSSTVNGYYEYPSTSPYQVSISTSSGTADTNRQDSYIARSKTKLGGRDVFCVGHEAVVTCAASSITKVLSNPFVISGSSVTESAIQNYHHFVAIGVSSASVAKAFFQYANTVNDYRFVTRTDLGDTGKIVTWAETSPTTSFVFAEEPTYSGTSPTSDTETFSSSFPVVISSSANTSNLVLIPAGGSWYSTIVGGISTAATTVSRKVYRYG